MPVDMVAAGRKDGRAWCAVSERRPIVKFVLRCNCNEVTVRLLRRQDSPWNGARMQFLHLAWNAIFDRSGDGAMAWRLRSAQPCSAERRHNQSHIPGINLLRSTSIFRSSSRRQSMNSCSVV